MPRECANATGSAMRNINRQKLVKSLTFDKFHAVEDPAVWKSSRVVDRNNAWMFQRSQDVSFAQQAGFQLRQVLRIKDLQGHVALQRRVLGKPDRGHASAGNVANGAISCAREVGNLHVSPKAVNRAVTEPFHFGLIPRMAFAS